MGPKDTPFEGGIFVAKLTFVSAPPPRHIAPPFFCFRFPLKHTLSNGMAAALRLPIITI